MLNVTWPVPNVAHVQELKINLALWWSASDTTLQGPKCSIVIKEAFTCQTSDLVYCISCHRCPALYAKETGRTLRQDLGEHPRSIDKNLPGFPVASHFNANGHSLHYAEVHSIMLCIGNKHWKRQEMQLIFQLGTSQLCCFNDDLLFLWILCVHILTFQILAS